MTSAVSDAVNAAVAGLGTSPAPAIAVSVLRSTEQALAAQVSTLFSTIGLGRNFDQTA